jgi:hypothetical protein
LLFIFLFVVFFIFCQNLIFACMSSFFSLQNSASVQPRPNLPTKGCRNQRNANRGKFMNATEIFM